ncbi:MAG: hypothetical protein V1821_03895, partial [bacterium]
GLASPEEARQLISKINLFRALNQKRLERKAALLMNIDDFVKKTVGTAKLRAAKMQDTLGLRKKRGLDVGESEELLLSASQKINEAEGHLTWIQETIIVNGAGANQKEINEAVEETNALLIESYQLFRQVATLESRRK